MDILKQPAQTLQTPSVSMASATRRDALISDIAALNLQPGKEYPARVVMTPQTQTAPLSTTAKSAASSVEEGSSQSKTPATDKNTATSKTTAAAPETKQETVKLLQNEYLLRVNAKTILINSDKQLAVGDKIVLSLDPNMSNSKPSLIARILQQAPSSPLIEATTGLAAHSAVQSSSALQNTAILSSQQIAPLLQALNQTLDKQVPLQEGFRQLSSLLLTASPTENKGNSQATDKLASRAIPPPNGHQIDSRLRQLVQQQLISALSRTSDILSPQTSELLNKTDLGLQTKPMTESHSISTGTLSSNAATSVIKSALLNSGLFMESTLLSQPDKLQAFKEQLNSLQSSLQQINSQTNGPKLENTATLQRLGNSLNKIQQTIEQLLQNTHKTVQGNAAGQHGLTVGETNQALSDLKASLVSLAAQTARQLNSEISAEALKNLFLLPISEDYALSPFAFPLLSSTKASSARSLFEKQEFSTGQLLKLLAGMIHRLQFNQLHSLLQSNSNTDAGPAQQSWFFELPVINPQQQVNTFNFRIDKEPQSGVQQTEEEEKSIQWKLLLSFDLEHLGPIYVQVKFMEHIAAATPSVSSILWADKAETVQLLQSEANQFQKSLENLGLNVTELRCEQGQPNQTRTRLDRHLVDTRA